MSFFQVPPRYHTFLVTLWEEGNQDPKLASVWRFRLEDPRTGQRRGFSSLSLLIAALEQQIIDEDENDWG